MSDPTSMRTVNKGTQTMNRTLPRFLALVVFQILVAFLATSFVVGVSRTFVFCLTLPFATMLIACVPKFHFKRDIITIVGATIATLVIVHVTRQHVDSAAFLGPFVGNAPFTYAMAAYVVFTATTVFAFAIVRYTFGSTGKLHKLRWFVAATVAGGLLTLFQLGLSAVQQTPARLLASIAHLESLPNRDSNHTQQLSVFLSTVGRLDEAEALSDWGITSRARTSARPLAEDQRLDVSSIEPLPWESTMREVAARERLIVIMEAHNAPSHRRWIEQVLPILHTAGFHDYAAEGLHESGTALSRRGYPVATTGAYVIDPCFGNLLRTALQLEFRLHAYEPSYESHQQREHDQAANLARLFAADPDLKLVVHCGYAHAQKRAAGNGDKLMAAWLWEMTGIEPYCILQTWHGPFEQDAKRLADVTAPDREPYMLSPLPKQLRDFQFQVPEGSFDALVVHASARADEHNNVPSMRTTQTVRHGTWSGAQWPVLIGAFKNDEGNDAIALDQVMLREGERDFVLTVPDENYTVRVFGTDGEVDRKPDFDRASEN